MEWFRVAKGSAALEDGWYMLWLGGTDPTPRAVEVETNSLGQYAVVPLGDRTGSVKAVLGSLLLRDAWWCGPIVIPPLPMSVSDTAS